MITYSFINYFSVGAAGALAVELLKLYEYRGKLKAAKFHALLTSLMFWSILVGMLLASGFIAWAIYAGEPAVRAWQLVVAGVASRSITRELAAGQVANNNVALGGSSVVPDSKVSARDILL